MDYYDQVKEAADTIRSRIREMPRIAIVLGSGLGDFTNSLCDAVSMPYADLPHWPVSNVVGHEGKLVVGTAKRRTIAALAGRSHAYEGHDLGRVTFAVRVLGLLGVKSLILTNAAGGVNTGFAAGALMVIDDHINLMGGNPLVGTNDDRFGPRFPDMSEVYSARLRTIADQAAREMRLPLPHGIYVALLGPSYETPAEIRYLRTIGGDAVGMSTVPEVCVARHMGARVIGISCITNQAAGITGAALSHGEVTDTATRVRAKFEHLLDAILGALASTGELAS
jgi:purine-nucleoside phosphorylase